MSTNIPINKTFVLKAYQHHHRHPPLRKFTTTMAAKTSQKQNQPIIISRQYKNELLANRPQSRQQQLKSTRKIANESEEKPWPMHWQILGYSLVMLTIPVSIATFAVESYTFRDYILENNILYGQEIISFLREHFGPQIMHYPELSLEENNDSFISQKEQRYFNYTNDAPSIQISQNNIENEFMNDQRVEVMLNNGLSLCYLLKGNVLMNMDSLKDALQASIIFDNDGSDHDDRDVRVTLDFLDHDDGIEGFDNNNELIEIGSINNYDATQKSIIKEIRKASSAFSTWHYFPNTNNNNATSTTSTSKNNNDVKLLSDKEIQISKFQYREKELLTELNDNFSTKSIDELMNELNYVRKELYKLEGRWMRWGWVSLFR